MDGGHERSSPPENALLHDLALAHDRLEVAVAATLDRHQEALLAAISQLLARGSMATMSHSAVISDVSDDGVEGACSRLPVRQNLRQRRNHELDYNSPPGGRALTVDSVATFSEPIGPPVTETVISTKSSLMVARKAIFRGAQDALVRTRGPLDCMFSSVVWLSKRREFETTVALVILVNAIGIGFAADWSIKHPGEERPGGYKTFDWIFLCLFSGELFIRILSEKLSFFSWHNKALPWNVFDTILVLATSLNEFNPLNLNLSVVRVFRILRIVHAVRVIRLLKSFKELRMMVSGIMNCGKTLLWSVLLLSAITYTYAVLCLQLSSEWLASLGEEPSLNQAELDTVDFVRQNFPSLEESVYTLFKALSGGTNWGEISDPLRHVSVWLLLSFPLYIVVTVFCVLNIITAAFVEAAARSTSEEDSTTLEHIDERQLWLEHVTELFARHDTDGQGGLDFEKFQAVAADWRTQAYLRKVGLDFDYQSLKLLFFLFDWDGDGRIDIDEFAQGLHHLRGPARSLDMYKQFKQLSKKIDAVSKRVLRSRSGSQRRTTFLHPDHGGDTGPAIQQNSAAATQSAPPISQHAGDIVWDAD